LPVTVAMPNMSVDKCVDLCTEKVSAAGSTGGRARWCGTAEGMGDWLERKQLSRNGWMRSWSVICGAFLMHHFCGPKRVELHRVMSLPLREGVLLVSSAQEWGWR
jgi:hypothetical protein